MKTINIASPSSGQRSGFEQPGGAAAAALCAARSARLPNSAAAELECEGPARAVSKSNLVLAAVALAVALSACSSSEQLQIDPRQALLGAPEGPLVALVNGEAISEPLLTAYARGRNLDPALPEQRQQALDGLIEGVLLAQEAAASGQLDDGELQAQAALVRMQHIAAFHLARQREQISVEEAQILDLYEREKARAGDTQWRAQHLLFEDEAAAKVALARAQAPGTSFDALLAEYANGGAKQARELPWSNASQLPESLVEALRQLQDGEVAPLALQSRFGWHVLRRLESRAFDAPPLEQVREGARRQLIEAGTRDYLAGLRAKAEISTSADAPAAQP
jgi:peptidyl-prolyl cis-trans isomerase C